MSKTKVSQKLKKLNFTNRERRIEPMTINDKYLLRTIESIKHENIQLKLQEGVYDPNILKTILLSGVVVSLTL